VAYFLTLLFVLTSIIVKPVHLQNESERHMEVCNWQYRYRSIHCYVDNTYLQTFQILRNVNQAELEVGCASIVNNTDISAAGFHRGIDDTEVEPVHIIRDVHNAQIHPLNIIGNINRTKVETSDVAAPVEQAQVRPNNVARFIDRRQVKAGNITRDVN